MENKIFKTANKILEHIITIFFLIVILVGLFIVSDVIYVYTRASQDEISRFKPDVITEETLREFSEEAVAWIVMDDTNLDYPIMQSDNNTDYLNKDPQGNYALSGSIFLDFRNASDFSDPYNIAYGHHMANHLMFGALDLFKDETYFDEHRTGTLYTRDGEYPITTVAYVITTTDCYEIFGVEEEVDYDAFYKKNAEIYKEEANNGHLLALTTCKDPETTDRTALIVAIGEKTSSKTIVAEQ